jgi:hypothetical protein
MGGTQPGNPDRPDVPQMDVSYKNEHGGVTRMSYGEDGTYKCVETRAYKDGHSEQGILVERRGGSITLIETYFGADGHYQWQMRMTQESPTSVYVHDYFDRYGADEEWNTGDHFEGHALHPRDAQGPMRRNVDPDAPGSRSTYPPACAFADPDCDMPLMIRFHQNRPDRRGRPDDTAGMTPRLRPDLYGTVVNPGLEAPPTPGTGTAPQSARSHDGGALTNPGGDGEDGDPPRP